MIDLIVIQRIKYGTKSINECEYQRIELNGLVETHPKGTVSDLTPQKIPKHVYCWKLFYKDSATIWNNQNWNRLIRRRHVWWCHTSRWTMLHLSLYMNPYLSLYEPCCICPYMLHLFLLSRVEHAVRLSELSVSNQMSNEKHVVIFAATSEGLLPRWLLILTQFAQCSDCIFNTSLSILKLEILRFLHYIIQYIC